MSEKINQDITVRISNPTEVGRKLYFINEQIEWDLTLYLWTGCTKILLRDRIMSNATELIRQIIRKQGLHTIYPGQEESAFGDLLQTAWCQIERTLYKYRGRPHCRSCFNSERPSDSLLYEPAQREYGIKTMQEVMDIHNTCPYCSILLLDAPIIEPIQGLYGGSSTILYRGMSKVFNMWCVTPDTQIFSCCGITSIDDTIKSFSEGCNVHTHGLDGINPIQAAKLKSLSNTIILKTELNYNIECSPEHQLLTLTPTGPDMVEVNNLKTGDLLAIQSDQKIFGNNNCLNDITLEEMVPKFLDARHMFPDPSNNQWIPPDEITTDLAYVIGLFLTNAMFYDKSIVLRNLDDDIIKILFNSSLHLSIVRSQSYITLYNNKFIEFLQAVGFSNDQIDNRFIPKRLLQSSKQNIIAMLSGLFDGCGHSSNFDGSVGLIVTSPTLRNQIRMLLLNIGIITKLSEYKRTKQKFPYSILKKSWQLLIPTSYSKLFYDIIGFNVDKKQKNKEKLINTQKFVYGFDSAFSKLREKYGSGSLGYNSIKNLTKSKCDLENTKQIDNWNQYQDDFNYQFVLDRIDELTRDNDKITWLPIVSINKSKSKLCEISVDSDTHSYIANGIVSHNSQIARTVILAYIKKEGRDRKNSNSYVSHLGNKSRPISDVMARFLTEARNVCRHNDDHIKIIEALDWLINNDDRPHDGIIGKLVEKTSLSRSIVTGFIKLMKLRSFEFTDSPINRIPNDNAIHKPDKRQSNIDFDEE